MIFELNACQLDVDVERTRAFYAAAEKDISCGCDGCENFVRAIGKLSKEAEQLLRRFGIDPACPAEVGSPISLNGKDLYYEVDYHICGSILRETGPRSWDPAEGFSWFDEEGRVVTAEDLDCQFTKECYFVADDFPRPVFQMKAYITLPWVLDGPNKYL